MLLSPLLVKDVLASSCQSKQVARNRQSILKGAVWVGKVGSFQLSLLSRISGTYFLWIANVSPALLLKVKWFNVKTETRPQ